MARKIQRKKPTKKTKRVAKRKPRKRVVRKKPETLQEERILQLVGAPRQSGSTVFESLLAPGVQRIGRPKVHKKTPLRIQRTFVKPIKRKGKNLARVDPVFAPFASIFDKDPFLESGGKLKRKKKGSGLGGKRISAGPRKGGKVRKTRKDKGKKRKKTT